MQAISNLRVPGIIKSKSHVFCTCISYRRMFAALTHGNYLHSDNSCVHNLVGQLLRDAGNIPFRRNEFKEILTMTLEWDTPHL